MKFGYTDPEEEEQKKRRDQSAPPPTLEMKPGGRRGGGGGSDMTAERQQSYLEQHHPNVAAKPLPTSDRESRRTSGNDRKVDFTAAPQANRADTSGLSREEKFAAIRAGMKDRREAERRGEQPGRKEAGDLSDRQRNAIADVAERKTDLREGAQQSRQNVGDRAEARQSHVDQLRSKPEGASLTDRQGNSLSLDRDRNEVVRRNAEGKETGRMNADDYDKNQKAKAPQAARA